MSSARNLKLFPSRAKAPGSPASYKSRFDMNPSSSNPETVERKRILIVDDHPMMRAGLIQLINKQSDMEVCGEAGGPEEAMQLLVISRPDLILVDISMKGSSGLEFIRDVSAVHGHIPMLVVSMHDEKVYAERAL